MICSSFHLHAQAETLSSKLCHLTDKDVTSFVILTEEERKEIKVLKGQTTGRKRLKNEDMTGIIYPLNFNAVNGVQLTVYSKFL
jgi:hypothetical protein